MVLVTGATGGVGRRVVDILRNKGIPVRVLVQYLSSLSTFGFSVFIHYYMDSPTSPSFVGSLLLLMLI